MGMRNKGKSFLQLHLSILLAGATGLFGRFVSLQSLPLVWYRVAVAAVVLMLALAFMRRLQVPARATMLRMMGCGVLLSVHWVFFYGSIKAANVSIGVVCFAVVGFFTALIEPLVGRKRPSWRELLLSLITVCGVLLIFGFDTRYRHGIVLGMVSSVLYSLFSVASKRVVSSRRVDAGVMLLYELLGGIVVLTAAMPLFSAMNPAAAVVPQGDDFWLILVFASVFTVLPFLLQLQALRHISAFTVNLSYNLEPLYSIILASIFFAEAREMGWPFWTGLLLIVLSVLLQTRRQVGGRADG